MREKPGISGPLSPFVGGLAERRMAGWRRSADPPVSKQTPWYQGILQGILRFWGLGHD